MSKELRDFVQHFTPGLQMGMNWAAKREANRIDAERNKIKAQSDAIREARENRRLDIYARSVDNAGVLARARAEAALRPKGGGGGKAPANYAADDADTVALRKEAADRGLITAPAARPPAAGNVTNNYISGGDSGGSDPLPEAPPPPGEFQRGGMVRKMAGGGSIEQGADMSIEEALHYGDKPQQGGGGGGGEGLGRALGGAYNYWMNQNKPEVTPTGSQGSGAGGVYTTGDSTTGILSRGMTPEMMASQNGGTVRRFQNGGRVMQAIDTGTSGPGSGFGYRAPPPAGRR